MGEKEKKEKVKTLHRIPFKDSDGDDRVLVIQSDPDQFIVAEERVHGPDSKQAGELKYVEQRYYPSMLQALYNATSRLAKEQAVSLDGYVEALNSWSSKLISDCHKVGLSDPRMKGNH